MATRRSAHRHRTPLSRKRALDWRELEIEVQALLRRLTVRMPGTSYAMEFAPINDRLGILSGFGPDDINAQISSAEFAALAEKAAREKVQDLGWSGQPGPRSRMQVDKQPRKWPRA